jgi:lipopolysaccharide export system protein LptC
LINKTKSLQAVGIVLALILLVWQLVPSFEKDPVKSQALVADWFGVDVAVTEMDEVGNPKRAFTAARLTHYEAQNMTDLLEPHFTLIPESKIPWHLNAGKGRTFHGAHTTDITRIDLWNEVTVWQPKESTPRPMRMITSTLAIFPDEAFAQTDQRVDFDQPGHRMSGEGMRAKFNERSMELLNKVRSEHVRQPLS